MKLVCHFHILLYLVNWSVFFLDVAPCNLYPTPSIRTDNISWLYEALADNWIRLGLPNDTRDSILNGAFYTATIRPGLRLISLNMNYCTTDNYWLLINSTDPLGQLQWVSWLSWEKKLLKFILTLVNQMAAIRRRSRRESASHRTSASFFVYRRIQLEFQPNCEPVKRGDKSFIIRTTSPLVMKTPLPVNSTAMHIQKSSLCSTMRWTNNDRFPWYVFHFIFHGTYPVG